MKKKIIGFFILLVMFVLALSGNLFAYTLSDFVAYAEQLKAQGNLPSSINYTVNRVVNEKNKLLALNVSSNISSFIVNFNGTSGWFYVYCWTGDKSPNKDGNGNYSLGSSSYLIQFDTQPANNFPRILTGSTSVGGTNKNFTWGLLDTSMTFDAGWYINGLYVPPALEFDLNNSGTIEVFNLQNVSAIFKKFQLSRSVTDWKLGIISGYDDSMRVDVKLARYLNDTVTLVESSAQWYGGITNSYGGLFIDSRTGNVYINNLNVYYKQAYSLWIELEGDVIYEYPIYFVDFSYNKPSGDLISPDVDTNDNLNILQGLQDLYSVASLDDDLDGLIDSNFPSGNLIGSGEIYSKMGYHYIENPYSNWLYNFCVELLNALIGTGDETLQFNFYGNLYVLHSSDYTTPTSPLKTFVSLFLTAGTLILLYQQFHVIFLSLTTFSLSRILYGSKVDYSFYM